MLCERNCCQDFALCFAGKLITSFQWTAEEEEGAFWSTRQLDYSYCPPDSTLSPLCPSYWHLSSAAVKVNYRGCNIDFTFIGAQLEDQSYSLASLELLWGRMVEYYTETQITVALLSNFQDNIR